jgi:signal transduction histidine kinase
VLLNLLQNSLNVSPPGGRIKLVSEFTVDAWRVSLEDQGPGVPPAQRERIFDRFVRLESGGARDVKGSGLGLAISRSIIGLHRGVIRAEAASGDTGLRVVFELPIGDMKAPPTPASETGHRVEALQPD